MNNYIKYKYAFDGLSDVVDIMSLAEEDRKDYVCISCGNILRPVLPKINKKHFRHKTSIDCSEETYLHRLAKLFFYKNYLKSLEENRQFIIEFFTQKECNRCREYGPCAMEPDLIKYDLTTSFKNIKLETYDDGFTPDILLFSAKGEKLYVEIAVTHASSDEKIKSGTRIIELKVESEEDIKNIADNYLSETNDKVSLFNFKPKKSIGDYSDNCRSYFNLFILWESGKSLLTMAWPYEYETFKKDEKAYIKPVRSLGPHSYMQALEEAYLERRVVKNCFLCRHYEPGKYVRRNKINSPVFCTYLNRYTKTNSAAMCEHYVPDPSVFKYTRNTNNIKI